MLLLLLLQAGAQAAPRDAAWLKRHEAYAAEARREKPALLLLGDSITEAWRGQKALWDARFAPLKAANLGIAGDCTQHLLWRLRNGAVEGLQPKAVMLLIGTNNLGWGGQDVDSTLAGVTAVVDELRERLPAARILLLGVFPRGEKPGDPLRAKIRELNAALAGLKGVTFLDLGPRFLQPDGRVSKELLPDSLHLSDRGYRLWADAVKEELERMLYK